MKQVVLILFLTIGLSYLGYGQKLKVNENIDVHQTKILIDNYKSIGSFLCSDTISQNAICIKVSTLGELGYYIILELIKDKVSLKIFRTEVEFVKGEMDEYSNIPITEKYVDLVMAVKSYSLEINKKNLKKGDIFKAKFDILAEDSLLKCDVNVRGEIFHVLNEETMNWIDGRYFTNADQDKLLGEKK